MSGTSSATGGFLRQLNATVNKEQLIDTLQETVVGVTGLSPDLVRPRWQPQPPPRPPADTSWVSIGIVSRTASDYPALRHFNGGPSRLTRWSEFTLLASFYGPDGDELAEVLRDGLYMVQNLELLAAIGVKLTSVDDITAVPDVVNAQFIDHVDLSMRFAMAVDRDYNILDIASSAGTFNAEGGVDSSWNATE
jgi:hypothetical protein